MTDFTNAHAVECEWCSTPFVEVDGRLCNCCPECGEDDWIGYEGIYICRNCNWCSEL